MNRIRGSAGYAGDLEGWLARVRLEDGESNLAACTIKRRLASVGGLFTYLVVRGDVAANPVPRGLGHAGRATLRRPI